MRILVVGAGGTLGRALLEALGPGHDVLAASRSAPLRVDIGAPESIRALYRKVGPLDAVVGVAGHATFRPLAELTDQEIETSLRVKLLGQVNLVRLGFSAVKDGGSITVTSGTLARVPMRGSAAISLANAGLEGFVRAAALEAPRGIRVNVVSPPWVTETLAMLGMDTAGGAPAAEVAQLYLRSITGSETGATLECAR
ncbi:MAG TPA: short chain dehydrogenase [Anaeromyxobacter sp.]|nr:short chain dehydrogenase [Anaeromyxobacter sp.]